ncbi:uncharacterized protein BDV17DRAFT_83929 [Aspergillus undulatus]|uniref:uncharacterized protein n=1 Tax=Aspergillus undulatus TaxID=1810928 RepID=UPI003CCE0199
MRVAARLMREISKYHHDPDYPDPGFLVYRPFQATSDETMKPRVALNRTKTGLRNGFCFETRDLYNTTSFGREILESYGVNHILIQGIWSRFCWFRRLAAWSPGRLSALCRNVNSLQDIDHGIQPKHTGYRTVKNIFAGGSVLTEKCQRGRL